MKAVHTGGVGSSPCFMESNHHLGSRVNLSARLQFDITKFTSMDSSYSSVSFLMDLSLLLISTPLAALVRTLTLPVKVSDT